jgi:hypothetical protein
MLHCAQLLESRIARRPPPIYVILDWERQHFQRFYIRICSVLLCRLGGLETLFLWVPKEWSLDNDRDEHVAKNIERDRTSVRRRVGEALSCKCQSPRTHIRWGIKSLRRRYETIAAGTRWRDWALTLNRDF